MIVDNKDNVQWQIKIFNDTKFPFLIIDDWFSKNEEIAVWKELDYYYCNNSFYKRAENESDIARYENGEAKGKTNRIYLDQIYNNRSHSTILKMMYKQRTTTFKNILKDIFINHYTFQQSNGDNTLISYYENSDFYDKHIDSAMFSCLIWLNKSPKSFEGGELLLEQPDVCIKFKNNRLVFFPSWYYHAVTPVKIDSDKKNKNLGRYTITHFYLNR
jgi:Rps23 Pro-64 3,4-dihydroxylase Tpa1-like proline 4-hydroxylase